MGQESDLPASGAVNFGPTVTIFFSDIRGFTEYTDVHGDEAAYRMLQHHNTILQEQIALFGGHIVKTLGDSYMVSFDAARNALACAIAIQRTLAAYNTAQQGVKIDVGIGINTGEPIREGADLFGGSVNLASRICAVAGAGRTLVSESVRHLVGIMKGAEYIDRGYFELKGFQEPQHLFEVDWSGVASVRAQQVAPPKARVAAEVMSTVAAPASSSGRNRMFLAGAAAAVLAVSVVVGLYFFKATNPSGTAAPVAAAPATTPPSTGAAESPSTGAAASAVPPAAASTAKPPIDSAAPTSRATVESPPAAPVDAKTSDGLPAGVEQAGARRGGARGERAAANGTGQTPAQGTVRILSMDDFSDPARGLFQNRQRGIARVTLANGAPHPYQWDYAYASGALVAHIKGMFPNVNVPALLTWVHSLDNKSDRRSRD